MFTRVSTRIETDRQKGEVWQNLVSSAKVRNELCLVAESFSLNFTIHLSHQIVCLMHEVLNVDNKKN